MNRLVFNGLSRAEKSYSYPHLGAWLLAHRTDQAGDACVASRWQLWDGDGMEECAWDQRDV